MEYTAADLLAPLPDWDGSFYLVEIYTLQVLPSATRLNAMDRLTDLVAPAGTILVTYRGREPRCQRAGLGCGNAVRLGRRSRFHVW